MRKSGVEILVVGRGVGWWGLQMHTRLNEACRGEGDIYVVQLAEFWAGLCHLTLSTAEHTALAVIGAMTERV